MKTRLMVVDTETGGLDPSKYSILSIGAVIWEDGDILDEISIDISEKNVRTEVEAMAINRINLSEHKAHALSGDAAMKMFLHFVAHNFPSINSRDRVTLVGHNISFDVGFLKRFFRQNGQIFEKYFSHRSIDTATIVRFLSLAGVVPLEDAKSSNAFKFFGVEVLAEDRHTALGDARATAKLLSAMIHVVRSRGFAPG